MKTRMIEISEPLPSKKNSYVVRYSPQFWRAIGPIVAEFSKLGIQTVWIGPSSAVKTFQTMVAWRVKSVYPDWTDGRELALEVGYNGKGDLDNMLGALLDGIEQSGRIQNDKQFSRITIHRNAKGPTCAFRMTALED